MYRPPRCVVSHHLLRALPLSFSFAPSLLHSFTLSLLCAFAPSLLRFFQLPPKKKDYAVAETSTGSLNFHDQEKEPAPDQDVSWCAKF